MNRIALAILAALLAACSKSEPTDPVESLLADRERLHKVEQQCADNGARISRAECNAAAEAQHRLFIGDGPKYTPPKDAPKFRSGATATHAW